MTFPVTFHIFNRPVPSHLVMEALGYCVGFQTYLMLRRREIGSDRDAVTQVWILAGAILGLAGPGRKIAGLMTLTVVRPDDMADRILDRQKHPQWQGERTKMVYAFTCPPGALCHFA